MVRVAPPPTHGTDGRHRFQCVGVEDLECSRSSHPGMVSEASRKWKTTKRRQGRTPHLRGKSEGAAGLGNSKGNTMPCSGSL